ncbi:hypothetical protein GCM10010211_37390 [Streptomyces albospinus]|uniref:Nudix hydrolase domain-containing protein n=1 Tax=Streptomyces albospinus TaxID=285515 RepID=A0ABQ2V597_9ACTN|nr:translation initiation factor 2 [Streptomyces albospinus]GGU68551.1 hypothetical protein GCM10010211_37390 [Streptomyces albospinus]
MPKWKMPDLPDGPHRVLNRELHALHKRAGYPSAREIQARIDGGRVENEGHVFSYTKIHHAFTKAALPSWGVVELIVEELAALARPRLEPQAEADRFKILWDRAADPESEVLDELGELRRSAAQPAEPAPRSNPRAKQLPCSPQAEDLATPRDRFRLFGRAGDCTLIEGDGTWAVTPGNLRVLYTPERVSLPPEVRAWRQEIAEEQKRKEASGLPHLCNSKRFAVQALTVSRTSPGGDTLHTAHVPIVTLSLCDADYYDFLATARNLDRPRVSGLTLRKEYLERNPACAPPFMNCSFGVNVAVETGRDHKMIFSFRSGNASGSHTWRWNSSSSDGLSRQSDLSSGSNAPNLYAAARRALREELAIEPADAVDLELLGFALDLKNHQWAAFFRAVLTDLRSEDLRARLGKGYLKEEWEHDRYVFCDADPESVLDFIAEEPTESWAPCAPALFLLALVRAAARARGTVGRLEVEAAERAVMRRRGLGQP